MVLGWVRVIILAPRVAGCQAVLREGFQFFAVGGQGALSGGDEVALDALADGGEGLAFLFLAHVGVLRQPALHGAFRQVYGVDEGLLLAFA